MGFTSFVRRCAALSLGLSFAMNAWAVDEKQLIDSINVYRSEVQKCAGEVSSELPPLAGDPRLAL